MSRAASLTQHYSHLLSIWPKDGLRPEIAFQKVIKARSSNLQSLSESSQQKELLAINALYAIQENRASTKYALSPAVMHPASNPEYYERLRVEIDEVPSRSWLQDKIRKWTGRFRFR